MARKRKVYDGPSSTELACILFNEHFHLEQEPLLRNEVFFVLFNRNDPDHLQRNIFIPMNEGHVTIKSISKEVLENCIVLRIKGLNRNKENTTIFYNTRTRMGKMTIYPKKEKNKSQKD